MYRRCWKTDIFHWRMGKILEESGHDTIPVCSVVVNDDAKKY